MTQKANSGVGRSPNSPSFLEASSSILEQARQYLRPVWFVLSRLFSIFFPLLGTLIVLLFVLAAIFAEDIAPYDYDDDQFTHFGELTRWQEPCYSEVSVSDYVRNDYKDSCANLFGTNINGQDIYSRIIFGTREIFRLAGLGTLVAVIIGSLTGLLIGYYGGLIDEIASRFLDSLMSIPVLILALVLVGALGSSGITLYLGFNRFGLNFSINEVLVSEKDTILVVLMVVYSPIVARVVRSNVLEIRTRGFVEAAKLRGESTLYILIREILPSVIPTLVVEASLRFSYAIFLVASLGYLGLGADPPTPNWGLMVFDAYQKEYDLQPFTLTYPAGAIAVLVVSVNLMSDGIKRLVQRA